MDALKCIQTRHSIRSFTKKKPSKKLINEVLEHAVQAPSGKNMQPWYFQVIQDQKLLKKLGNLPIPESHRKGMNLFLEMENPNTFILVYFRKDRDISLSYKKPFTKQVKTAFEWSNLAGICSCITTLLLAANAKGLGTVWIGEVAMMRKQIAKIIKPPKNCELVYGVLIGYPKGKVFIKKKKKAKEVTDFL